MTRYFIITFIVLLMASTTMPSRAQEITKAEMARIRAAYSAAKERVELNSHAQEQNVPRSDMEIVSHYVIPDVVPPRKSSTTISRSTKIPYWEHPITNSTSFPPPTTWRPASSIKSSFLVKMAPTCCSSSKAMMPWTAAPTRRIITTARTASTSPSTEPPNSTKSLPPAKPTT